MYLDIQRIKAEITMEHILGHYGIRIQLRDVGTNRLSGCCPIHHGDNPNAFHVDLKRNLFHCFTHCGGGSIFDFVMKIEQMDFYSAARKIWETFYPSSSSAPASPASRRFKFNSNFTHGADTPFLLQHLYLTDNLFRRPGVPILKLQITHPYLEKRNISPSLAMSFHMGYCKHGIMKDRIAIPIIDAERHIVAYAGRAVHDNQSPRYLFPKNFKKSQYLFNIQTIHCIHSIHSTSSIKPECNKNKPVFLVEGFFACIHIVKAGFDAIALMGTTVSSHQLSLMKEARKFYIVMLDGDEAGRKATPNIENKLNLFQIPFRTVNLSDGKQPDQLENAYLKTIENEYKEK